MGHVRGIVAIADVLVVESVTRVGDDAYILIGDTSDCLTSWLRA
jgi:hypothetical protein